MTSVRPSAKDTADFLRAEEKGRVAVTSAETAGTKARSARMVGVGSSKALRKRPRSARRLSASPVRGISSCTSISPLVKVPVLSRQRVSTRASVSMP